MNTANLEAAGPFEKVAASATTFQAKVEVRPQRPEVTFQKGRTVSPVTMTRVNGQDGCAEILNG